jgi:cyclic beta-1,2-glucan synthetase
LPLYALAGLGGAWLGVLAALGLIPSIDAAMALVNRAVTRGFGATLLPGLELRDGIPAHLRTVVAVPILLTTRAELEEQIERLEIHHLASPESELHFALLSDWTDAATETVAGDHFLLDAAAAGIARLNLRYGPAGGGERFLLFHRRRLWNEGQRRWIGWERKRGKLHELNRLLRGATDTTSWAWADACPRRPPACATSSRSTPIRGCRAKRRGAWSARWRTRSTVRASMPARGAWSRAMACCSRA